MEYKGKLYGKVGETYFPLEATSEDFDKLKEANKAYEELCDTVKYVINNEPGFNHRKTELYLNSIRLAFLLPLTKIQSIKNQH